MTKEAKMLAVVDAARKVVHTPIFRVPSEHILALAEALAALDAHTKADAETATLAVWSVSAGQSVRWVVAGAEDDRPDAVWETRLGTITLPITREGGR